MLQRENSCFFTKVLFLSFRDVVVLESSGKMLSETSDFAKALDTEGLKGVEKRSTLLRYFAETGMAKVKGIK